jgi:hypothetical protein
VTAAIATTGTVTYPVEASIWTRDPSFVEW